MRCAVLDDDRAQAQLVAKLLEDDGHRCESFSHGRTLINRLRRDTFDLLILDWNMPDMSGIDVLETIRQGPHADLPVLMLTSRSVDDDVVEGLNAGADDYIVKPISPPVFLARAQAVVRRAKRMDRPQEAVEYGPYQFDPASGVATVRGAPVRLTAKEMALAIMLFQNQSRPLSRSYLLECVWGQSPDVETRTLDAHVSRIRSKLGLRAENGYRVLPVYSYGYRLDPVPGGPVSGGPIPGDGAATP